MLRCLTILLSFCVLLLSGARPAWATGIANFVVEETSPGSWDLSVTVEGDTAGLGGFVISLVRLTPDQQDAVTWMPATLSTVDGPLPQITTKGINVVESSERFSGTPAGAPIYDIGILPVNEPSDIGQPPVILGVPAVLATVTTPTTIEGPEFAIHPVFGALLFEAGRDGSYLPGSFTNSTLTIIPFVLPGDADNDKQVTGADLIAVQQNFGETGADDGLLPGDANDDGQVTGADLIATQQRFGSTSVPSVGVPPPNPGGGGEVLLGDASKDGIVDSHDLIAVYQNLGNVGPPPLVGDANHDGQVTQADLISVQQNFGNALSPENAPVPEPGMAVLFVLIPVALLRWRR